MPEHDHQIGVLQAAVSALTKTVETSTREQKEALAAHGRESREGRAKMYEAMEAIRLDVSHAKRSIEERDKWAEGVDGKLTELEKWKQRGIGAMWPIGVLAALVSGVVALFWKWIAVRLGLG